MRVIDGRQKGHPVRTALVEQNSLTLHVEMSEFCDERVTSVKRRLKL